MTVDPTGETAASAQSRTQADPTAARDAQSLPRGANLGRYVVLERLGSGGMGVVYAAYDPDLDRKVAVKLLRAQLAAGGAGSEGFTRLLREAQAMARLSHPNVIAVHDVGLLEDQVFVAMEFVDGPTLGKWLRETARPWRETAAMFAQAGRGLAAAHAAGIVHRDFKPDNVIVGRDGRARVLDFGLARAAGAPEPIVVPGASTDIGSGNSPLHTPLTRTGAFMGTPAYMAPEQLLGQPTDARSDQFSFCVALYEALFGARPFGGDNLADLAYEVTQGRVKAPPADARVPAIVQQAILRGLQAKREDRFPSMDALLEQLAHDPAATRRRWARGLAALAIVLAAFGGWAVVRHQRGELCRGADRKLAGVWDAGRRSAVEAAFRATQLPYADSAFRGAERVLDDYVQRWIAMRTDACEATRVRGEQSEELLDLRMQCLDRRLQDVKAQVDVFSAADAKVVERAVPAAFALSTLDSCADAQSLRAPVRPPADPVKRRRVADLGERLSAVKALKEAGKYADGLAAATGAAKEAGETGYRPIEAEALLLLGDLQDRNGDAKTAEQTFHDALAAAESGRSDAVAAQVWTQVIWVVGFRQARADEANHWSHLAMAAVERAGGDEKLMAPLLDKIALVAYRQGKYEDAAAGHRRALAIAERLYGPKHTAFGTALNNLGNDLFAEGKYDEALDVYRRALAIYEAALGPAHPVVAICLNNVAIALQELGKHDEAIAYHQRALTVRERLSADSLDVAMSLDNLGLCLRSQNKLDDALADHRRALAIREHALGPNHPDVGTALVNIADILRLQKKYDDALASYQRALGMWEKALGEKHPNVAYALSGIGQTQLALNQPRLAVTTLERALALRSAGPGDAVELARTRFALARSLAASGKDAARARALAEQARDALASAAGGKDDLPDVNAWLARH
jgi:tetratricopeptide (TPR) repeat protein